MAPRREGPSGEEVVRVSWVTDVSPGCVQEGVLLTGDGAQVQVVSDHLLQLVVQGTLLELQAKVVAQVRVQNFAGGERERGTHTRTCKYSTERAEQNRKVLHSSTAQSSHLSQILKEGKPTCT